MTRDDITEFVSLDIFPTCVCEATTSERLNNKNGITITSRQTCARKHSLMTFGRIYRAFASDLCGLGLLCDCDVMN